MKRAMTRDIFSCPCGRRMAAALALALFVCATRGQARAASASDSTQAKMQFERGRAALKSGDLEEAKALFLASQDLVPKTATLMNLADCEERLGLFASAFQHLQEAILLAPPGDNRIFLLKQRAHAVEPRVPRLRVNLKKDTAPGAHVVLDARGLSAESLEEGQALDPGTYTLTVTAPGRKDRTYQVHLAAADNTVLTVEPGNAVPKPPPPKPKPSTPPPGAPKSEWSKLQIAGLAVGGVGLAGVIAGAVTGGMAVSRKEQLGGRCPVPADCDGKGVALAREGDQLGTASTIGLAAGGAALALGGAAFAIRIGSPASTAVVAVGPQHGSVTLRWDF